MLRGMCKRSKDFMKIEVGFEVRKSSDLDE